MDERQWLLGTSYNTGIECLQYCSHSYALHTVVATELVHSASMADEAKRWFESATVICRFVPDGEARAAKVRYALTPLTLGLYLRSARSPRAIHISFQDTSRAPKNQRTLNPPRTPIWDAFSHLPCLLVLLLALPRSFSRAPRGPAPSGISRLILRDLFSRPCYVSSCNLSGLPHHHPMHPLPAICPSA